MEKITIFLVKPHPPKEILDQKCPVPEKYKYAWEPIALKLAAHNLNKKFASQVDTEIWHLIDEADDNVFLKEVTNKGPSLVVFNEIDVLVNEVSKLALQVKKISQNITTIVGGKQTSLLRKGDKIPFEGIDYAIRGDGIHGLEKIVECILQKQEIKDISGLVLWNAEKKIVNENSFSSRQSHNIINNIELHETPVRNHTFEEYIGKYQSHPSILPVREIRTAPIYTGLGCPFNCFFGQSPVEYGQVGKTVMIDVQQVAKEIHWLYSKYKINNFFSLEPNVNLENLLRIYEEIEKLGIKQMPISGFVRAADIVKMEKRGMLKELVNKGMRIMSIGLDVPLDSKKDIYNKSFSYQEMLECLDICESNGIIVLSTIVGNPELTKDEFSVFLEKIHQLKVAEVDIRLAIALRNTKYYDHAKNNLLYLPDCDKEYYDRQNYRYQTLQYPGKIKPDETYDLVNKFYKEFYFSNHHIKYIEKILSNYPDTFPYFQRMYKEKLVYKNEKLSSIGDLLVKMEQQNNMLCVG